MSIPKYMFKEIYSINKAVDISLISGCRVEVIEVIEAHEVNLAIWHPAISMLCGVHFSWICMTIC